MLTLRIAFQQKRLSAKDLNLRRDFHFGQASFVF